MNSVAIVVQRWHPEITGGSEQEAGTYAKYLSAAGLKVDVLTTTARDATTWADHYPAGVEDRGDFRVLRFPVAVGRSSHWANLHDLLLREYVAVRSEPELPDVNFFSNGFAGRNTPTIRWPIALQEEWIRRQGPHCPELLEYLTAHRDHYDCFMFLTYLFSPTYFGAACVPFERILFVPTLHDEAPAYLSVFGMLARRVAGILWNTEAERQLGEKLWGPLPARIAQSLGGLGIDCPESGDAARAEARKLVAGLVETPTDSTGFALYCGRINAAKGCQAMIEWFLAGYAAVTQNPVAFAAEHYPRRLVLTGDLQMELPDHPAVVYLGYVSEAQKFALMAAADVFIMPSGFESLSVVTLEALGQGTPVLANAQSDVVEDHILRSGAGRTYSDARSFIQNLAQLSFSRDDENQRLPEAARRYVRENYSHARVSARVVAAVRAVIDTATRSTPA